MNNDFSLPQFNTFQEAYHDILKNIHDDGNAVNGSHEFIHAGFTVKDTRNVIDTVRKASLRYAVAEMIWYWAGSNSLKWINKFSTFWNHLSDDGETCSSAYGYILQKKFKFNQIEKVVKELKKDEHSRRATIKINTPRLKEYGDVKDLSDTKDEFCTLSLQFLIRDNKLNMIVNMRSNDLWKGLPYDAVYFVSVMNQILDELHDVYPKLEAGTYTHFVGSIHIYDNDMDKVEKCLDNELAPRQININDKFIRENADKLYDEIEKSFLKDDGTEMTFKEYKESRRFENIIEQYPILQGDLLG